MVAVLEMLREEFKITMMLSGMNHFINMSHNFNLLTDTAGCRKLSDIQPSIIAHESELLRARL